MDKAQLLTPVLGHESESRSSDKEQEREQVFITRISVTNVVSRGRRSNAAVYYVSVEINGKTTKTSIQQSKGKDLVEWGVEILLPSERSTIISFKVFKCLERKTRHGEAVLLEQFKSNVGDVLDSSEELRPIRFLDQGVSPSLSFLSLRIITERRVCATRKSRTIFGLVGSDMMINVALLIDGGHRALLRYHSSNEKRDLDEAISYFERVRDLCSPDHPGHSVVLFNLATAKFIHCRDNNHFGDLVVPIELYRDALHIDNQGVTALELCFAFLSHLQTQEDKTSRAGTNEVVKGYAYEVAWLALQMAGIIVPIRLIGSGISQTDKNRSLHDDKMVRLLQSMESLKSLADRPDIQETLLKSVRADLRVKDRDPQRRSELLMVLATSLLRRFEGNGDIADIDEAILTLESALPLTPDGHPDKSALLGNLGSSWLRRAEHLGNLTIADIDKSILIFQEALRCTLDDDPEKLTSLTNLGNSYSRRFEYLGEVADIAMSIMMQERAVRLAPDGHPHKPTFLNHLGKSFLGRFERLGDIDDINKSISMIELSLRLTPDGHPLKPSLLNNLGISFLRRFEHISDLADINKSISSHQEAVDITPNGHPNKPTWLSNLGNSLIHRFNHLGDVADMNKSISTQEEALSLVLNGHNSAKGTVLTNFGLSLTRRFERLRDVADIDKSISILQEASQVIPDYHPHKPSQLNNLGISLSHRFELCGDIDDCNKSILELEKAVCLTPDGHPDKRVRLINLSDSLSNRFERLGDIADINMSISMEEEALRFTPDGHSDKPTRMSKLGNLLRSRFECLGDLADITKSISLNREALNLTPNNHASKPAMLISLALSLSSRFQHLGDLVDIDKCISIQEETLSLTPDGDPSKPTRLNNLGCSLLNRFEHLGDLADVTKSISLTEEAVRLTPDTNPDKPAWLSSFGNSLLNRFNRLDDPADIDMSVSTQEEATHLTPNDHPDKPIWLNNLGNSLSRRFQCYGDPSDIDRSILAYEEAVDLTPDGHPGKSARLNNLGTAFLCRFQHLGDPADISKAISMSHEALRLTPDGHPDKPAWLNNLGNAFMCQFDNTQDPSSFLSATSSFSMAARASAGPINNRFYAARQWIFVAGLERNFRSLLDAYTTTIDLLPKLAWLGLPIVERHRVLLEAATVARNGAAAALEAGCVEMAADWLERGRSVVWSQFLQLRTPVDVLFVEHPDLARQFQQVSQELEHACSRDPAATYRFKHKSIGDATSPEEQVQKHHHLALRREQLLTDIRSLPGFQRFLLPKSIKELASSVHSGPVVYLNASRQRCDALIIMPYLGTTILVPLPDVRYSEMQDLQCVFRLVLEHNRLVFSRDDIISALAPPADLDSSRTLIDSLLDGDNTQSVGRAARIKPQRIGGYTTDDLFKRILSYLWNSVVRPVLEALGFSAPPSCSQKLPRIFWCPTGPFAFLPIHAAGIYDTTEAGTKLSDFAISSYTPTLTALASSTTKDPSTNICLVDVPQPPTDGQSALGSVTEEIAHIKSLSTKSPYVTVQDSCGTIEDVMEKMKHADWVHFACHGVQDPQNPLDSGLCLADERRLKLSDIIRLSRPQGGLAFLSACQTAQGDENLAEESVHLAAGMLLAGYGGVIATMWAIRDPDAPKVTRDVYGYLFRDGKVADCTEAAEALHYAVRNLRDSGASFSSWVPFIHVGK